ncbi:MAG: AmmeMemoRadiSam system radical SAM enzyme [Candidatus Edwardsbacteria bacterium]
MLFNLDAIFKQINITRREFFKKSSLAFLSLGAFFQEKNLKKKGKTLGEAMFYKKLEDDKVQCEVCFRQCIISQGNRGFCRNRENRHGLLYNLVHSKPCAIQIDPIEKEPSFHNLPGTNILCFGTASCNFRCKFCQNWHMSQRSIEETQNYSLSPEETVNLAIRENCPTVSFTYNDPIAFYEYMIDIVKIAKEKGLNTLCHTNGSLRPAPLRELLKFLDAITIDLKGSTEHFYRQYSSASLSPVLASLKIIKESGRWLEIVNLVIPTANDNSEDIKKMCLWIKENLGEDVPLHFNRFYPSYQLTNLPPTPVKTLESCKKIAEEVGIKFIYVGNVPGHKGNSTYCPRCKKLLISRFHFSIVKNNLKDSMCKFCNERIPGIWKRA